MKVASAAFVATIYAMVLYLSTPNTSTKAEMGSWGELLAALAATMLCAHVVRRCTGPTQWIWLLFLIASGTWALGQGLLVLAQWTAWDATAVAPIIFLLFPVAASAGLLVWLYNLPSHLVGRGRDLLDGVIIGGSLLTIAWVTTLSSVVERESASGGLLLSLAQPAGDQLVAALVLVAIARGSAAERTTLAILALGMSSLTLADSIRVYYDSVPGDTSSDWASVGTFLGFLLVAVAASTVSVSTSDSQQRWEARRQLQVLRPSPMRLLLPFLPFLVATVSLVVRLSRSDGSPWDEAAMGSALLALVLLRLFLAMSDNERLLAELVETRDLLKHQALHDGLTGLANRVLFGDRLDRALMLPANHVTVMFCDLDDFKNVNDEYGHEAGDLLLKTVADRLLDCVRATDTVARLGGDEFAILLEGATDATRVARRIVASVQTPLNLNGVEVFPSVSVGVSRHLGWAEEVDDRRTRSGRRQRPVSVSQAPDPTARESTARALLRRADGAMYIAKGRGKGRYVLTKDMTDSG